MPFDGTVALKIIIDPPGHNPISWNNNHYFERKRQQCSGCMRMKKENKVS